MVGSTDVCVHRPVGRGGSGGSNKQVSSTIDTPTPPWPQCTKNEKGVNILDLVLEHGDIIHITP